MGELEPGQVMVAIVPAKLYSVIRISSLLHN